MENKLENVENSQTEKELIENSQEREQAEKDFKFVFVGGNEPLVNESFMNSLKVSNIPVAVFELTNEEMRIIMNRRARETAEETSVDYINNEENKAQAREWVKTLIHNHLLPKGKERSMDAQKLVEKAFDGDFEVVFTKTQLKRASGLSWSQFEELFSTLELFSLIKYTANPKEFTLLFDTSEIANNKIEEIKQFINLTVGKVIAIQKEEKFDADTNKKLKSIQRTFTNALDKL